MSLTDHCHKKEQSRWLLNETGGGGGGGVGLVCVIKRKEKGASSIALPKTIERALLRSVESQKVDATALKNLS